MSPSWHSNPGYQREMLKTMSTAQQLNMLPLSTDSKNIGVSNLLHSACEYKKNFVLQHDSLFLSNPGERLIEIERK
jgi:hypothetical protein